MSSRPLREDLGRPAELAQKPKSDYRGKLGRTRHAFIASVGWLSLSTAFVAGVLLVASIMAICDMVFVRYVLNESTYWQTEFVVYAITGATLLGSPWVLLVRGHVSVTLVPDAIGGVGGRLIYLLGQLAGFAFCALLAYSGWYYFFEAFNNGWTSDTIWAIRLWIPVSALPVGLTVLTMQYLAEMLRPPEE